MEHGIDGIDGVSKHWSASRDVGVMRTVKAMTSEELRNHAVDEFGVVLVEWAWKHDMVQAVAKKLEGIRHPVTNQNLEDN
jgi:hypothetical protein